MALTGFGLDGGDDPAFDYVMQAATGVAAMTGDPDGPPTLPGLFVGRQLDRADRGARSARADRRRARRSGRRVAARRDAVAVELPGVGVPQRRCRTAVATPTARTRITFRRSCSRPPTDTWRCSSPTTGSGSRSPPRRVSTASRRWPSVRRVAKKCSPSSPRRWPPTPQRGGKPGCVRSGSRRPRCGRCPRRWRTHPEVVVTAGDFRLVGSPIRVAGYQPEYRPPPGRDAARRLSRRK